MYTFNAISCSTANVLAPLSDLLAGDGIFKQQPQGQMRMQSYKTEHSMASFEHRKARHRRAVNDQSAG